MTKVKLITLTPDAEAIMVYIARASSPHQDNPEITKLIQYVIRKKHWSVFEHASATFEIITSRMLAPQMLRHTSFKFQEFSQRYSEVKNHLSELGHQDQYIPYTARRQDTSNRQLSIDDMPDHLKQEWLERQKFVWEVAKDNYDWAIEQGIAKECARAVLPLQTQTKLYMTGCIRSWIHYFESRCSPEAQAEHREIALLIRDELAIRLPIVAKALEWN